MIANFKLGTLEDEQNDAMKSYAINLNQSVDANGDYVVKFNPTELKLNNFTWNVDTSQNSIIALLIVKNGRFSH